MKLVAFALALASTSAAVPAAGTDEATKATLQLRPKVALVPVAPGRAAPFVLGAPGEPDDLDLLPKRDLRQDQSRSSCSGERSLCYDPNSGRIVYKPARQYMPGFPGLTPENISVKRDRIVLRYSF